MIEVNRIALEIERLLSNNYTVKKSDLEKILNMNTLWDENNYNINKIIINTALLKILDNQKHIIGHNGEKGVIQEYGKFIKFVPINNKDLNIEYTHQYFVPAKKVEKIGLKKYEDKLVKEISIEKKKQTYVYNDLISEFQDEIDNIKYKSISQKYKFTIDITELEIIEFLLQKSKKHIKLEILKNITKKIITDQNLTKLENKIYKIIEKNNIFYSSDLDINLPQSKQIYGFKLATSNDISIYTYDNEKDEMKKNAGIKKKIMDTLKNRFIKKKINPIFGFLKQESDGNAVFKILDASIDDKKSRTGSRCDHKNIKEIVNYINKFGNKKYGEKSPKQVICNNLEIIFRRLDNKNGIRWFLSPEEYILYVNLDT